MASPASSAPLPPGTFTLETIGSVAVEAPKKRVKTSHEVIAHIGFAFTRETRNRGHRFAIMVPNVIKLEVVGNQVAEAMKKSEYASKSVVVKVLGAAYHIVCVYMDESLSVPDFEAIAKIIRSIASKDVPATLCVKSNADFMKTVWESFDDTPREYRPDSIVGAAFKLSSGSANPTELETARAFLAAAASPSAAAAAASPSAAGADFTTVPAWMEPDVCFRIPYHHVDIASYASDVPTVALDDGLRTKITEFLEFLESTTSSRNGTVQGSPEWLAARGKVVTASIFGTVVGHNKYSTPFKAVEEKIGTPQPTNEAMAYGTNHEPIARRAFWKSISTSFSTEFGDGAQLVAEGLLTSPQCPWMSVSPDNILVRVVEREGKFVLETKLVEYKCPFGKKTMASWPYFNEPHRIPLYYYDQVQGIMGYVNHCLRDRYPTGLQSTYFVVWTQRGLFCMQIHYDDDYYQALKKDLWVWYLRTFVPSLITGSVVYVDKCEESFEEYFC